MRIIFLISLWFFALSAARAEEKISTEVVVDAPVSDVWSAWTTSAGLRAWLAPQADVELRVGGVMRVNYNPKGSLGDASTVENKILSFDPERMLSIQVSRAPADFPFRDEVAAMWTVLYFQAEGAGKTRVTIVGNGFATHEQSQKMRAFFEQGNAYTLALLQRRFQR